MRANGYSTPVPRRSNELKASKPGEVVTYQLSEEELAKYRALPVPDKKEKMPVGVPNTFISEEQRRRANMRCQKEENEMKAVKEGPDCGLTKEILIEQVAKGETLSSIERAWGMKYNTIHNWVKKWNLKGINQAKAQELLNSPNSAPEAKKPVEDSSVLRAKNIPMKDPVDEARELYRTELEKLRQANDLIKAECDRLLQERDDYKRAAEELEDSTADHEQIVEMLNMAKSRLNELEKENGDLLLKMSFLESERQLEPVEHSRPEPVPVDYVNHPPHYNRGGIECIDAIEAATGELTGPEAYHTGQVLKYVWRWKHKNGFEDLQKARWYIDRLLQRYHA